jgi:hypothetical protein
MDRSEKCFEVDLSFLFRHVNCARERKVKFHTKSVLYDPLIVKYQMS